MFNKRSMEIPLNMIVTNPNQPRKKFSEEELCELENSIKEYGVLQPIIVKKGENGYYYLVAGERRVRASKNVGLSKIPAIISQFDEKVVAVISIVENVQRENLSYIEEAYAYKKILDDYGITQSELADKIGKKQSTISNKLRIISLPLEIQESLINADLTERHARALLKIENEDLRKLILNKIIKNNLNVKQTEKLIRDTISAENNDKHDIKKIQCISYKIYLNTIRNAFSQIKDVESNANITEVDQGDFMEVKITIPKNIECFT